MAPTPKIKEHTLDARGLFCPEPVMLLHKKIREIKVGDKVIVLATDPSTTRDIPKFCHFLGHELIESKTEDNEFVFIVLKAETSASS
jgi:tRNA 2-thiouridine synthesizing protein A